MQGKFVKTVSQAFPFLHPWEELRTIRAIETENELVHKFHPFDGEYHANTPYSFSNSGIEFRQHQGTLDTKAINSWIQLAIGIVQACRSDAVRVTGLINAHLDDRDYTVIDLLQDLELHSQARYYAERGIYRHPLQTYEVVDGYLEGEGAVATSRAGLANNYLPMSPNIAQDSSEQRPAKRLKTECVDENGVKLLEGVRYDHVFQNKEMSDAIRKRLGI